MGTLNNHNRRLAEVVSGTDTSVRVRTEPSSALADGFASLSRSVLMVFRENVSGFPAPLQNAYRGREEIQIF
jgi:hypothetical protein